MSQPFGFTTTVKAGQIPSAQSNFTWLVTTENFPLNAINGGANSLLNGGGDLRCYTDNTKTTQLPIELVTFVTGGTPEIVVWGLSPLLGVGDTVYFEKDLTEISQPPVTDTYGRNAVWLPNNKNVWHLSEGSGTTYTDSTGVADGSSSGSGITSTTGISNSTAVESDGTASITTSVNPDNTYLGIDMWASFDDITTGDMVTGVSGGSQRLYLGVRNGGFLGAAVGDSFIFKTDPIDFSVSTLVKMTIVADSGTGRVYVNGVQKATFSYSFSGTQANDFQMLGLGGGGGSFNLNGKSQHVRIPKVIHSADYLLSEYNNQSSPTDFWESSAWEEQTGDIEVYDFSGIISHSLSLSAALSKTANKNGIASQSTTLSSTLEKQVNVSGIIDQSQLQQANLTKKTNCIAQTSQETLLNGLLQKQTNLNGTTNQNYQLQTTITKNVALTAEIAQSYVMSGYFSTETIEIHQFSANISITPVNSANLAKKINHEQEITQPTTLSSEVTKQTVLQANNQQKITLLGNINKYCNITGAIEQPITLNAIFYNLTAPVHLRQFRINGQIVFQRFNGATVNQRFNGVIH